MAKSTSLAEVPPESTPQPRAAKARKRRTPVAANANALAESPSQVKPMLIGLGVGAALGATALLVTSQIGGRPRQRSGPTITGMLAKAALIAIANAVAHRAVRLAADKATLSLVDAWNPLKERWAARS